MDDDDRKLLNELQLLGQAIGPFALAVIEDRVSRDEQLTLGTLLVNIAERIRDRAVKTPITIEGMVVPDVPVALPDRTVELDWRL
ncbi:MAG: hypothetical protein LC808_16255 [Actinobacteria bacterium]|nr:hypothetical protein [Actinomycetota bacterium]